MTVWQNDIIQEFVVSVYVHQQILWLQTIAMFTFLLILLQWNVSIFSCCGGDPHMFY